METMMWSHWGRISVVGCGLTLLGLGVLPAACTGSDFKSCSEGKDCNEGTGGGAGGNGDAASSISAGGVGGTGGQGVTSAGGAAGAPGESGSGGTAAGGSGGTAAGGSGGTAAGGSGAGASSSGGSASTSTTDGGEAGEDGLGEGGAGATGSCEDSCDGSCCDGACVDLESSLDHCGACGAKCTLDDADEVCAAGSCVVTACWDRSVDCNGDPKDGCEADLVSLPDAPRLTRPMIGAFSGSLHTRAETGSLRPEFVWTEVEPESCDSLSYQIQIDDTCSYTGFGGCKFPSPEFDVSGLATASFVPDADLPVDEAAPVGRRYYWRVRACETHEVCSEWSEVFYVDIGRVREDVTGDGYPDVVGATADGELFIARGSDDFFEQVEAEIIPTTQTPLDLGVTQFSFLGDVNGDGFNDVGGVGLTPSLDGRALYVWHGAEAFGGAPGVLIGNATGADGTLLPGLWAAGDVDHDGYGDLMLRRITVDDAIHGWLYLKLGGPVLGNAPDDEVPLTDTRYNGTLPAFDRAATSGDFNGDGYPDLASDARDGGQHAIQFMLGGGSELSVTRTVALVPPEDAGLCKPMMATLDFNGDDIDDVALLCRSSEILSVFFGSQDLANEDSPVEVWTRLATPAVDLAVGDADNSGFDDIFVSGPMALWGAVDPDTEADVFNSNSGAEQPMAFGDHDADGLLDLVRADRWYPGLVLPGGENAELTTEDGDELDVIALAH